VDAGSHVKAIDTLLKALKRIDPEESNNPQASMSK
jgi:hypothetical protein